MPTYQFQKWSLFAHHLSSRATRIADLTIDPSGSSETPSSTISRDLQPLYKGKPYNTTRRADIIALRSVRSAQGYALSRIASHWNCVSISVHASNKNTITLTIIIPPERLACTSKGLHCNPKCLARHVYTCQSLDRSHSVGHQSGFVRPQSIIRITSKRDIHA